MLQELHGWLEEALITIERFQEASNFFKLLENWKVFEFCDGSATRGQPFPLCPAERPVLKHYVTIKIRLDGRSTRIILSLYD